MDLSALVSHFPYFGLFVLLLLSGLGLPLPEEATLMLCGFFIFRGEVRYEYAIPVVYIGMLAGDLLLFFAGRRWGAKVAEHAGFQRVISPKRLEWARRMLMRRGVLFIFAGRQLAGLRAQVFVACGITGMKPLRFIVTDALAAVVTLSVMVGIGFAGGNSYLALKRDVARLEHIFMLVGITALLAVLFRSYFRSRGELS